MWSPSVARRYMALTPRETTIPRSKKAGTWGVTAHRARPMTARLAAALAEPTPDKPKKLSRHGSRRSFPQCSTRPTPPACRPRRGLGRGLATGFPVYNTASDGSAAVGWQEFGGTSIAAPQWAGLFAIVDEERVNEGGTPLTSYDQTLPALYSLPSTDFTRSHRHWLTTATYRSQRLRLQLDHWPGHSDRQFAGPRPGRL